MTGMIEDAYPPAAEASLVIADLPDPLDEPARAGTRRIETYLDQVAELRGEMRANTTSVSRLREATKHLVPIGYRLQARLAATRSLARRERRRATLIGGSPLLHLGSGGEPKPGWVNIDLAGEPVDLAWDLSRPLPFAEGTAAAVFHEHTLEHLPLAIGMALMRDSFRVLAPGARLRIGVPDAGLLLHSYAGDGADLEELAPGRPTRLLAVQETFYWHHHVTMYDTDLLVMLFEDAGFVDVQRRDFGDTDLPEVADTEARRAGTLYVEGTKPAG